MGRAIAVASIPSAHVYLAHLRRVDGSGPVYLPHPLPEGAPNRYGTRWPPVALPLDWLQDADYDVLHVQFDFDVYPLAELAAIVAIVRRRRIPLVFTVHDLRTTTQHQGDEHDQRVDLLIREADALITLTRGAAAEIGRRWGREALVVPHPHVVPLDVMERLRRVRAARTREEWHLGVHLRWLRANTDPVAVRTLADAVADHPDAVLDVFIHRDVLEQRADPGLRRFLQDADAAGRLRLHPHDEMTDPELWDSLLGLDATVLPYRFGTHSGWLEACRDLGTTVIAPTCGYYQDQGPILTYRSTAAGADRDSLTAAVDTAYRERPDLGATVAERTAQRDAIVTAHERLYQRLLETKRGHGTTFGLTALG